jgi:hypothetical protein
MVAPKVDAARDPAPTPYDDAERRQITAMSCELIGMSGRADGVGLVGCGKRLAQKQAASPGSLLLSDFRLARTPGFRTARFCDREARESEFHRFFLPHHRTGRGAQMLESLAMQYRARSKSSRPG